MFRPQQRVGQVNQKACGDDAGQRIVEHHGSIPLKRSIGLASASQPLARVGVANGGSKEAEAQGQHDQIKHGILPHRA